MAQWLSWLERRPVTAKVESSSLFWVVSNELTSLVNCIWIWNLSSAGRASALQAEGHRFEPYRFHILKENGEIAQLARAHGSYPWCRGFESPSRYLTEKSVTNKDESVNRVKGLQAFLCCRHIHTKIYKISFYYCHNPQNPL